MNRWTGWIHGGARGQGPRGRGGEGATGRRPLNSHRDTLKWMCGFPGIPCTCGVLRVATPLAEIFLVELSYLNDVAVGVPSSDTNTPSVTGVLQEGGKRDIHLRGSMWCRARVVGGHATIGRLSNNDFSTFQAIRNFFEKSRWTVTRQWSEVTRPSADCQTRFFDVSSN